MSDIKQGGCLCGQIRYEARGPFRGVVFCHCGQCRKQTGYMYAASNVARENLTITQGEDRITWYEASDFAKRGFCSKCGSALFWHTEKDPHISVLAGSFDAPSGLEPLKHIFTHDKGDFYDITDHLPQS